MFTRGIQLKAMRSLILILFLSHLSLHASYTISGTITYEKDIYSSPKKGNTDTVPADGIRIEASNGISSFNTFTDINGDYSITVNGSNYKLTVKSETEDVSVFPTENSNQVYGKVITSGLNSAVTRDYLVTKSDGSGAINIAIQIQKGIDFFKTSGYPLDIGSGAEVVFSSKVSSSYFPATNSIRIGTTTNDPDEFDDDVILHEFGHMAMDLMSRDDSNGGDHFVYSGQSNGEDLDQRLAYSEGAATWIACAIADKNSYLDYGHGISYSIPNILTSQNSEKSSEGPSTTTSEWAVNYVLYRASNAHTNN